MTSAADETPVTGAALLAEPAYRAVRLVALARVRDIAGAYQRFTDGDAEGLHDVRVAMRRLRTWIRAFRPWFDDTLRAKTRRRLRTLARATSDARDTEVAAAWVEAQTDLTPTQRPGVRAASAELITQRDAALREVGKLLAESIPRVVDALARECATDIATPAPMAQAESMADAVWPVIERHAARVTRALERVASPSDLDAGHRARIAAKRLRYVLEPLHDPDVVKERLAPLVDLQDTLGGARDAHQMARRYVREVGEMAARDARQRALSAIGVRRERKGPSAARVRPGLIELARRAHLAERRSFAAFRRRWGKRRSTEALLELQAPFMRVAVPETPAEPPAPSEHSAKPLRRSATPRASVV